MIFLLFFLILVVSFLIRTVDNIFYGVWLWQVKEYRPDRLLAHLRETKEGKRFLINKSSLSFWALFLLFPLSFFETTRGFYLILAAIVFIIDATGIIKEIKNHSMRRPVLSKKAIIIIWFTFFILVFLLISSPLNKPALLVVTDRLIFLLVTIVVFLVEVPSILVKILYIELAKRKISQMKRLTVIGITGSYGKSSTKEFIADFLSTKYNVLKTPGSINTDIGIARLILKDLKPDHEIFVVEIGAYKIGEIESVCEMVKPKIGIITGINEQHLSLFGSLENTKKAKFELIDSLPTDGIALFNGDDTTALAMSKWSKIDNTYIYTQKQLPAFLKTIKSPLLSNIASAYFIAKKLGVSESILKKNLANAVNLIGVKLQNKGDIVILDDSFNTNPNGFYSALEQLASLFGKKILVTPGIIELGSQSERIHRDLGEKIGTIADVAILTNDNFVEPVREGLKRTKFDMRNFLIPKREELVTVVKNQIKGKTTILLEGRMPSGLKKTL